MGTEMWHQLYGPHRYTCPSGSRMINSKSLLRVICRSGFWVWCDDWGSRCLTWRQAVPARMTWPVLMRGILGVKRQWSLDRKDLTIEMVATLRLPRPSRAINSGPNNAETLRYYFDICSETRTLLVLLSCCISSFTRLVMSSLSRPTSSSSAPHSPRPVRPLSSSSSSVSDSSTTEPLSVGAIQVLHPVEEVARGDDPDGAVGRSDSLEQVISPPEIDWVDPKVTRITFAFTTETSVANFLERVPILKADASLDFFRVEPCLSTETICLGRSSSESPFFYMYSCLFSDLHVYLPFDNFTMGVLKALNVAPTQLHPNTWAVTYNPRLLLKYDYHINVQVCNNIKSIKYLYKH